MSPAHAFCRIVIFMELCTSACLVCAQAAEITYYVSLSGSDAWSGKLPEPSPEKTDGPFASIYRARDVIRGLKTSGLACSVKVMVRGGTYYLRQTIVLGPQDSGSEKSPITYEAYPGEKVILSGGRRITTPWKTDDGRAYYTDVPEARDGKWKFRQLFVNDRREIQARYPNFDPNDLLRKGWLFVREDRPVILAGLAKDGDWVEYRFDVRAKGIYSLWIGYATVHKGIETRLRLKIDGKDMPLPVMPPSGGWRSVRYVRVGQMELEGGKHVLRLERCGDPEQRIHLDAFVFTDNQKCAPTGFEFPPVIEGEIRLVVEAESTESRTGGKSSIQEGFQTFTCARAEKNRFELHCPRGTLRRCWAAAPDAEIHIFAEYGWYNEIARLAAIDLEKSVIRIEGKECQGKIWSGNRFFVANVLEELDEPGEWYLDERSGRLYYWPREGSPEKATVIAPVLDRIFDLKADVEGKERVRYITLRGLTLAHTDYTVGHVAMRTAQDAAVMLENAWNCAVEDCTFTNIGGYAVRLHLDSCENRIAGNTVTQAGAGGVLLTSARVAYGELMTPGEAAARCAPIRNTITRNHIHHCGAIRKYVSGVHLDSRPESLAKSPGNAVSHNLIHDMPRLGIFAFRHQGGNVFEYNHIHNVMLESDDGGGIHICTGNMAVAQSVLRNNVIHDVFGPRFDEMGNFSRKYGFGLYLDGATSNCLLTNNIVYRTSWGTVFLHGGKNNIVENNVLMDDAVQQILISNYTKKMSGNKIRRNIICHTGPEAKTFTLKNFTDETLAESDYNLFWAEGRPITIDPIGLLGEWQKKGFDTHSLVAAPLFADPAKGGYSLRPKSPALRLGFVPIDARNLGVR